MQTHTKHRSCIPLYQSLHHSICEYSILDLFRARTAELCVDLGWMYDGEDDHHKEHEQCVEDVQEHFVRDEVSVVAW